MTLMTASTRLVRRLIPALVALSVAPLVAAADLQLPPPAYAFEPAPGCDRPQRGVRIYDDCADQVALFIKARAEAFGAKKQLVVFFGANWCPSCRSLKPLVDGDQIRSRMFKGVALKDRVHVVDIAISRLHEGRIGSVPSGQTVLSALTTARPDVKQRSIPFLAVVDPVTGRVSARNLDDLQGPDGWNAAAVATVIAAAEEEARGGAKAPSEPNWFQRKWRRWYGP